MTDNNNSPFIRDSNFLSNRTSSGFTLAAIALVIHEVHCQKCKSLSRYSQGTMLKLKGSKGEFIYVQPKASESVFELQLPREKRLIPFHVDACENCFTVSEAQEPSLFEQAEPSKAPQKREYALVGVRVGKRELLELREKSRVDALQRSNLLAERGDQHKRNAARNSKKAKEAKAKASAPSEPSILEIF